MCYFVCLRNYGKFPALPVDFTIITSFVYTNFSSLFDLATKAPGLNGTNRIKYILFDFQQIANSPRHLLNMKQPTH